MQEVLLLVSTAFLKHLSLTVVSVSGRYDPDQREQDLGGRLNLLQSESH